MACPQVFFDRNSACSQVVVGVCPRFRADRQVSETRSNPAIMTAPPAIRQNPAECC